MRKIFDPKITPGPWEIGVNIGRKGDEFDSAYITVGEDPEDSEEKTYASYEDLKTMEAGPELLDVLKAARKLLNTNYTDDIACQQAENELELVIRNLDKKFGKEKAEC